MRKYDRPTAKIDQCVFAGPIQHKKWEEGQEVYDGHAGKVHHAEKKERYDLGIHGLDVKLATF